MNITFNGKTAVVTGGTGGIGSAIAKTLLESGAQVALIDVSVEKLREMEKQLSAYGTVKSYPLNVTDTSAIPDCIRRIRQEMGEIDVLIQAGMAKSRREARELIQGGSIQVNGEKVTDLSAQLRRADAFQQQLTVLRRGKKNYTVCEFDRTTKE